MLEYSAGMTGIAGLGRGDSASGGPRLGKLDVGALFASPNTWAHIYGIGSILFLTALYFGFGGLKGDVGS